LRGLALKNEAEVLIRAVTGVEYMPLERQDQCCGFGGSFAGGGIRKFSGAMVADKVGLRDEYESGRAREHRHRLLDEHRRRPAIGKSCPTRIMHLAELLECR